MLQIQKVNETSLRFNILFKIKYILCKYFIFVFSIVKQILRYFCHIIISPLMCYLILLSLQLEQTDEQYLSIHHIPIKKIMSPCVLRALILFMKYHSIEDEKAILKIAKSKVCVQNIIPTRIRVDLIQTTTYFQMTTFESI